MISTQRSTLPSSRGRVVLALALLWPSFSGGNAAAQGSPGRELVLGPGFERSEGALALPDTALFDLGVVDFDDDGDLDLFSSNHFFPSGLLENDGHGRFTDVAHERGFSPDRLLDGSCLEGAEPTLDGPGLYIFITRHTIRFIAHELPAPIDGVVRSRYELKLPEGGSRWAEVSRVSPREIRFTTPLSGRLDVSVKWGVRVDIEILSEDALSQVKVGRHLEVPEAASFRLFMVDRHGQAWADIDGDGALDVFIARGGNGGRVDKLLEPIHHEWLLSGSKGLTLQPPDPRFQVSGRTRSAGWVDFDSDGDLDLFLTYGAHRRDAPYPQLWARDGDELANVTSSVGLEASGDTFVWVDLDSDGDPDLLTGGSAYYNTPEGFQARSLRLPGLKVSQFAVADVDGDLDPDVLAFGARAIMMWNEGGKLRALDATTQADLGLPASCVVAAWVDIDNDGRVDLHCLPSGLYRQESNGRFQATGLLGTEDGAKSKGMQSCAWFDADNDGSRDVLCTLGATETPASASPHSVDFVLNRQHENHWLEVDLEGAPGNRQAIGAHVEIASANGRSRQGVGWNETSRTSQGHYRLYFGLGEATKIDTLTVVWPDGTTTTDADIAADQVLRVVHPASAD